MTIPRLKDVCTGDGIDLRVSAATVVGVLRRGIIFEESREDILDGFHASGGWSPESALIFGLSTSGHKVIVGVDKIPLVIPPVTNGLKKSPLPVTVAVAVPEDGLKVGTGDDEITGEFDIGNIFNVCIELLGATGIDAGGEI